MEQLPPITVDKARGEINIALTRQQIGIQKIQTLADSLVFNEDQESIEAIKSFNEKTKAVIKAVELAHFEGKNPYRQAAEAWDTAKRETLTQIEAITKPISAKYQLLANEIQRRAKEKEAKEAREKEIRTGVENSIIEYSKRIAAVQTVHELTSIELSISNQKSSGAKVKYGDLHQEAINAYNERIIPLLKEKKEGLITLGEMETEFGDTGDYERMEELQSGIEQTRNAIMDAEVKVQEAALGMSFTEKPTHEVIIPSVKPRRTTIHWELVDSETALKKAKDLLTVSTNDEACKTVGNSLLGGKENENKTEVIHNGIKFYKKFLY